MYIKVKSSNFATKILDFYNFCDKSLGMFPDFYNKQSRFDVNFEKFWILWQKFAIYNVVDTKLQNTKKFFMSESKQFTAKSCYINVKSCNFATKMLDFYNFCDKSLGMFRFDVNFEKFWILWQKFAFYNKVDTKYKKVVTKFVILQQQIVIRDINIIVKILLHSQFHNIKLWFRTWSRIFMSESKQFTTKSCYIKVKSCHFATKILDFYKFCDKSLGKFPDFYDKKSRFYVNFDKFWIF